MAVLRDALAAYGDESLREPFTNTDQAAEALLARLKAAERVCEAANWIAIDGCLEAENAAAPNGHDLQMKNTIHDYQMQIHIFDARGDLREVDYHNFGSTEKLTPAEIMKAHAPLAAEILRGHRTIEGGGHYELEFVEVKPVFRVFMMKDGSSDVWKVVDGHTKKIKGVTKS